MRTLCKSGVTVILTTHYIEEARNASVVAFMRSGKILAEDEPNLLLDKYVSTNLEEVFLKLCDSDDNDNKNNSFDIEIQNNCYENAIIDEFIESNGKPTEPVIPPIDQNKLGDNFVKKTEHSVVDHCLTNNKIELGKSSKFIDKVSATSNRNIKRLTRNWTQLIFFVLCPAFEFGMVLYCVGSGPTGLKLAIFNEELQQNISSGWGQLFVNSIDDKIFTLKEFHSFEEAMNSVESGQTYALIDINERFSKSLRLRALYGMDADEETLEESQIGVHIDWTNQLIALQIERHLFEAVLKFGEEVAKELKTNSDLIKIPLSFEEPVHAVRTESYRNFILPSTLIILFYFRVTMISSHLILEEQKDGMIERSFVAGITALDFLVSHVLTQVCVVLSQLLFMIMILVIVLSEPFTITLILMIALLVSQGLCALAFGSMVAILCEDLLYATMMNMSTFFIGLMIGGVFWPIENIPQVLQFLGQFLPNTLPIQSMRYILYRKWSLDYYEVYMGFVVTYVWFAFFLITALIFLRKSY